MSKDKKIRKEDMSIWGPTLYVFQGLDIKLLSENCGNLIKRWSGLNYKESYMQTKEFAFIMQNHWKIEKRKIT